MAIKENQSSNELEETKPFFKSKSADTRKYAITIYLTKYQKNQVKALVDIGIASSGTALARMGILELVRQNKHLLTQNIIPKEKPKKKPSTINKRTEQLDRLIKRVLNGNNTLSPDEIVKLRNKLAFRIEKRDSYSNEEVEDIRERYLKKSD